MEQQRNSPALSGQPAERASVAAKRTYTKPSFVFERAFETMALACGKLNASQAQCKGNAKKS